MLLDRDLSNRIQKCIFWITLEGYGKSKLLKRDCPVQIPHELNKHINLLTMVYTCTTCVCVLWTTHEVYDKSKLLKRYGPLQIPHELNIKINMLKMVHTYTTYINYVIYHSTHLNLKANISSYISTEATHFLKNIKGFFLLAVSTSDFFS